MKCAFVVAHPDDEILTCGGTLIKLKQDSNMHVHVYLAFSHNDDCDFSYKRMMCFRTIMHELKIDYDVLNYKAYTDVACDMAEALSAKLMHYDVIYTHHYNDSNTDHQQISKVVSRIADSKTVYYMNTYSRHRPCPNFINNHKVIFNNDIMLLKAKYVQMYDDINNGILAMRYTPSFIQSIEKSDNAWCECYEQNCKFRNFQSAL